MKNKDYPRVSAIAAMSENRVIGKDNTLPWHMPADLQHFKAITTGHAILMGRKTYESIGRPLPNRLNIVLTGNPHFQAAGCVVVRSLDAGIEVAAEQENEEMFIIGGAEVYRQLLPQVERLYLTIIHHDFVGDTYFPVLNTEEWREISKDKHQPDEQNAYPYSFVTLERV